MNQIVPIEQQTRAALVAGGTAKAIVPSDFEGVWRFSGVLLASGMAPDAFDTQEKIAVVVMHGMEIGLSPLMALQSIALINKRPSLWGDGALGLVQASPLYEDHEETIAGEGDARRAVCIIKRRGISKPYKGEYSVAEAKTAKLWGKPGPWTQYSDRMLKMRARGFALRDGFSDVLKGLAIAEEMRDVEMVKEPIAPPVPPAPPSPPVLQIESTRVETATAAEPEPEVTPPFPEEPAAPAPEQLLEWSFNEYVLSLDELLSASGTQDALKAAWTGRPQPIRKLTAEETKEMVSLLGKHKDRIETLNAPTGDTPPEPPVPEPTAPTPESDPAEPSGFDLMEQARGKAKEGLKAFNFWVAKLHQDEFEELEPMLKALRSEAAQAKVGA